MNKYCININENKALYEELSNKFNISVENIAYILNEFLIENGLTIDDFTVDKHNDFADYIKLTKEINRNIIRAKGVSYLANIFRLKLNSSLDGYTDDFALDISNSILNVASNNFKEYKETSQDANMTFEKFIKQNFGQILETVYFNFNKGRCTIETILNSLRTKGFYDTKHNYHKSASKLMEEIKGGDPVGDVRKELNIRIEQIKKAEKQLDYLNNMLHTDNWGTLCMIARKKISDFYNLKISENKENEDSATNDNEDIQEYDAEDLFPDVYDIEEKPKDGWMSKNEMMSAYKTASMTVKRYLSRIPNGEKTILNNNKYYRPKSLYNILIDNCYGVVSSDEMMDRIKKVADIYSNNTRKQAIGNAIKEYIIKDLETDSKLRTSFFVSLSKINKNYNSFKITQDGNTFKIISDKLNKVYDSEMLNDVKYNINSKNVVIPSLEENFKFKIKKEDIKEYTTNLKELIAIISGIKGFSEENINKKWNNLKNPTKKALIIQLLKKLGLYGTGKISDKIDECLDLMIWANDKRDFNSFVNYLSRIIQDSKTVKEKFKDTEATNKDFFLNINEGDNLFLKVGDTIENAFRVLEKYNPDISYPRTAEVLNDRGQRVTLYCDQLKSFMSQLEQDIFNIAYAVDGEGVPISNEEKARRMKEYLENNYLNSRFFQTISADGNVTILNKWFDDLINDFLKPGVKFEDTFAANFTTRINTSINKKHVNNFSRKDILKQQIAGFLRDKGEVKNPKYWWCPIFILGDSQSDQSLKVKRYGKYNSGTKKLDITDIVDALQNVFLQEVERDKIIDKLRSQDKPIPKNLEDKYGKCTFLPFIDKETKKNPIKVRDKIQEHLSSIALDYFNALKEENLDKFAYLLRGAKEAFELKEDENIEDESLRKEDYNLKLKEIIDNSEIMHFAANFALAEIMQTQFFSIDNAFFKTTKDFQKRNKANYANGNSIDVAAKDWTTRENLWDVKKPCQNAIYFNEIILNAEDTDPDFMKSLIYQFSTDKEAANRLIYSDNWNDANEIKRLIGDYYYKNVYVPYTKNKVTDGQAYRTLDSYRKICISLDIWSNEKEEAYNYIKNIDKDSILTEEQIKRINEYKVYFQPLKTHGRYNEKVDIDDKEDFIVPVEHKYAEIVLIPQLLNKNSVLRKMADFLEDKGIDMACANSCVKFGGFGECAFQNKKESIGDKNVYDVLETATIHKLNITGLKLQTNTPYHLNSDNLFGTQSRKLILNSLRKGKKYDVLKNLGFSGEVKVSENRFIDTENFTGIDFYSFYNSLIVANQLTSYNKFKQRLTKEDGSLDFEKISELIISNGLMDERTKMNNLYQIFVVNADLVKDFFDSLASNEDDFLIPFNEGSIEYEAFSSLASIFKKFVNKQMILGGSAVQASAFGFNGIETDYSGELKTVVRNGNVVEVECIIPFDFTVTDHNGKRIQLDYNTYCNEDGSFKEDSHGNTKIELDYPGILDLVAYRIPTEREYSMIKLKVKKCDLPINGGTIKVPEQYTTVAGFDFDIDKLYLMRKEFKLLKPQFEKLIKNKEQWYEAKNDIIDYLMSNPETSKYIKEINTDEYGYDDALLGSIWEEVYKDNPDIKQLLKREKLINNGSLYLNAYFNTSSKIAQLAQKKGFENVKEYKSYLFSKAAEKLGYIPTVVKKGKNYFTFDTERITSEGKELKDIINAAAKEIGVVFYWNKNEGKYEKYDSSKTILENTTVSRNNIILELIKDRLQSEDSFKSRYFPGGFAEARDIARYNRYNENLIKNNKKPISYKKFLETVNENEDVSEDEEIINPLTHAKYQIQNAIASKLIGLFANHNTNYSLSLLMNAMYLSEEDAIRFGKQADKKSIQSFISRDENIGRRVAELLAASVDAVKDPVFSYLNINLTTANLVATLVRLGYDFEDISLLMNQPIIKEICKIVNNGDNTYLDTALNEVKNEFRKRDIGYNESDVKITSEDLLNGLGGNIYTESQYEILKLFTKISSISKELNSFIKSSRYTAANSVGTTIGDFLTQQFAEKNTKYEKIKMEFDKNLSMPIINTDNEILSEDQYIEKYFNHPLFFEQCAYDCSKKFTKKINPLFGFNDGLYKTIIDAFDKIAMNLNRNMDKDTYNNIIRMLPDYLLSRTDGLFNPNTKIPFKINGKTVEKSIRDYYIEDFAKDLTAFINKHDELRDKYAILKKITKTQINVRGGKEYTLLKIDYRNYKDESYSSEEIINSWSKMMFDENKDVRDIAMHLFYYSYHVAGTDMNVFSFINLTPFNLKLLLPVEGSLSYREFFRSVRDGKIEVNIESFINDYILNNVEKNFLVKNIFNENVEKLIDSQENKFDFSLNLSSKVEEQKFIIDILTNINEDSRYTNPVIKVGNAYYKSVDSNGKIRTLVGNKDDEEITIKYTRIFPPALANKILYLSGGNSRNFEEDLMFIDREVSAYNKPDTMLTAEDYERANGFLHEIIENKIEEGELSISKEDNNILEAISDNKELFDKYCSIIYKSDIEDSFKINILTYAYSKLYDTENVEEDEFKENLKNLIEKDDSFYKFYSQKKELVNADTEDDLIHLFNGLVNLYNKNGNFTVEIDGDKIDLC